jgi:hypothetical protein
VAKRNTIIDVTGHGIAGVLERGERVKKLRAAVTEAEIAQRIEVLRDLEGCRNVSIFDYFTRDAKGMIQPKSREELEQMGGSHATFLKKLKVTTIVLSKEKDERTQVVKEITQQNVEIEIGDHLAVLKMLGEYLGLWDPKENKLRGAGNRLLADKTDQELEEMIRAAEKERVKA